MKEALTKAAHDLGFACDDLREALNKAGNVEGIVALALIGRANELRRDVDALLHAHESDTANATLQGSPGAQRKEIP